MVDMNRVAQGLKGQMGLDTGVNTPEASPATVNAQQNQPADTPAQQQANTQQVLSDLKNPPQQQASEQDQILAKKDQAISDQRAQIEGLQNNVSALTEKMGQMLEALAPAQGQKQQQPEVKLPDIPSDINERPAEEQINILTDAYSKVTKLVDDRFTALDDRDKKLLGPMAHEVMELKKVRAEESAKALYPNFDLDRHREDFHKKLFTTGLSPTEVARLVADPSELVPEPESDPSQEVLPSVQATTGQAPQGQTNDAADRAQYVNNLHGAILKSHQQGNTMQAKGLVDELLKTKLPFVTQKG